jgi:hypothetical protein
LVRQTRWHGVRIGELLADMAYSDGDTRVAVEAAGVVLVAKVPPVSNGGRLAKTDFVIDLDAARVICPAGQTTCHARPTTDAKGRATSRFHFPPRCALPARCAAVRQRHPWPHDRDQRARASDGSRSRCRA